MGVLFNFIPGSGLVAPGIFAERNSAGSFESTSWVLVLGHKSAAGSLANNLPTLCSTQQEAGLLAGNGSQLYETFRTVRRAAPAIPIYIAVVPVTGVSPVWTVTVGTLAAGGGTGTLEIAGRRVNLSVAPGETAATTATNLAAAINAWQDQLTGAFLPVTATAATNVVTLTGRHAGTTMNEIEVFADGSIAGNLFSASTLTIAATVPATGTADVSAALAAMGDLPLHWIVSPFSEDANITAARNALSDVSGRWAWLTQLYGHYFTARTGNTAALTSAGLAQNDDHITMIGRTASPTPGWEWTASLVGRVLGWLADATNGNAARNQSDLIAEGVRPPRDATTWPNYATRNALLQSGISTWKVNASGDVVIDKLITMRRLNAAGHADVTFRDIQSMAQAMHALIYIRAQLSYRHANKAIADENPSNIPTVSTPGGIKADVIEFYSDLVNRGLFEDLRKFASTLVVERDADNRARVNIGLNDMDRTNPLDIFALSAFFRA